MINSLTETMCFPLDAIRSLILKRTGKQKVKDIDTLALVSSSIYWAWYSNFHSCRLRTTQDLPTPFLTWVYSTLRAPDKNFRCVLFIFCNDRCWLDSSGSGHRLDAGRCEHSKEWHGCIKGGETIIYLSEYKLG